MSNYTITPFDIANNSGYLRAPVKVKGFWSSDAITAYIQRENVWNDDNTDTIPTWKVSISHSSGGRDSAAVEDDVEATLYFAEAMTALALYTKEFLSANTDRLEKTFMENRRRRIKEYEDEQAAQKKAEAERLAADPQITKDAADALLASVEAGKFVKMFARGSDYGRDVYMKNWGSKTFYIGGARVAKKVMKESLVAASARSAVV